jgi:hypothetical protein
VPIYEHIPVYHHFAVRKNEDFERPRKDGNLRKENIDIDEKSEEDCKEINQQFENFMNKQNLEKQEKETD